MRQKRRAYRPIESVSFDGVVSEATDVAIRDNCRNLDEVINLLVGYIPDRNLARAMEELEALD